MQLTRDPALTRHIEVPAASWYALAVLFVIHIFAYMDKVALSILMQPIKLDLHLSDSQLGLLSGIAFALFYAVMGFPLAWLADNRSRVRLIAICLTLWSLMTLLSGMARSFLQLFVARMGVGIGEAGCVPSSHSLISDYFPRTKRPFAISLFATGSAIGVAGGMMAVGVLGHEFGWRTTMQVIGLMGLPLALIALLTLREPARPTRETAAPEMPWQTLGALLRRRAFVHLVFGYAIAGICGEAGSQWYPSFMMRSFGMRLVEVGIWVGLITAAFGVLGILCGGYLTSRLLPRDPRWEQWIPIGATALSIPCFVFMVLSPNATMSLALRALMIFFTAAGQSVATAAIQSFAEPRQRATAVALLLFVAALMGGGGGPYFVGVMSDLLEPALGSESLRYAMLSSGVMLVWGTAHYFLASRNALKDRLN